MPGVGGIEVIAELKREHPAIPVVAISGRFDAGYGLDAGAAIALGAARALEKPLNRGVLLTAVLELLAARVG